MRAELEKALAGEGDWATLAEMAEAIVEKNPSKVSSLKTSTKISGTVSDSLTLDDGVYLVVAHDAKVKLKDKVRTYSFLPSLISLPSKYSVYYGEGESENNPQGDVNSADPGDWNNQVTIAIKPQVKETPISTTKTKSSSKPKSSTKTTRTSVKTGDDTNVVPFVIAMGVSGALLVGLFVYNRRTRKRDE
jgi:LPXTG-motif cell wall-anchored protein